MRAVCRVPALSYSPSRSRPNKSDDAANAALGADDITVCSAEPRRHHLKSHDAGELTGLLQVLTDGVLRLAG